MDKDLIKPIVSVIMPVYNGEKYLREAIESILNQTYTNFEFLIINDGSTDDTEAIVLSYNDNRINYVLNRHNIGLTKSLNKGIKLAHGKYIARMDADDISLSERLEKQVSFLETRIEYSLVGTSAEVINKNNEIIDYLILDNQNIKTKLFFYNYFVHTSICGRTSVFTEYKYRSDYDTAEDYFLWSQIAMKYKVANISEVLVKYRTHSENISTTKKGKQDETIKKVYAWHLTNLGFRKLTKQQIDLHFNILTNNADIDKHDNIKICKWLNTLLKQNKRLLVYDDIYFESSIRSYWQKYFSLNSTYAFGLKAIKLLNNSLNDNISNAEKKKFIHNCILSNPFLRYLLILWWYIRNFFNRVIIRN